MTLTEALDNFANATGSEKIAAAKAVVQVAQGIDPDSLNKENSELLLSATIIATR